MSVEVSWFSALCDDDYRYLGVHDPQLKSSWGHCGAITQRADKLGYETSIDFDDGEDAEDDEEITEPWTCTCTKQMLLEYDGVMAAQAELDEIARPLGGYADGWGTFGNVER